MLALAAASAGVVIYNTVRGRSESLDDTTAVIEDLRESFDDDRKREERQRLDIQANDLYEDDEPAIHKLGDNVSDRLYLKTKICPSLEARHWHAPLGGASGNAATDIDSTRRLIPPRQATVGGSIVEVKKYNPTLTPVNKNWIESDGSTVILEPTQTTNDCTYRQTSAYLAKDAIAYIVPNPIKGYEGRYRQYGDIRFPLNTFDVTLLATESIARANNRSILASGGYANCVRSGMRPTSVFGELHCGLRFIPLPNNFFLPERLLTGVVGATKRASWQLLSYCAIYDGYIPFEASANGSTVTYQLRNYNKCVVNPEIHRRSCSLASLGLQDPSGSQPLMGFSISGTDSKCTIEEASDKVANMIAIDSATRVSYNELPQYPGTFHCPKWQVGALKVSAQTSTSECGYAISGASLATCNENGLQFKSQSGGDDYCFYEEVKNSGEPCGTDRNFRIDRTTGRGVCRYPVGNISFNWVSTCQGWAAVGEGNPYDHDNNTATPAMPEDSANVYAYYVASTNAYHCSFKNRYTNSSRECLSFGYQPSTVGECEIIDRPFQRPAQYPPTCAVMRAVPYYTSQEQLFSISSLNLAFRNRSSIRGNPDSSVSEELFADVRQTTFPHSTDADKNDFLYDVDNNVLPNINGQLDYWYSRLIKPAVESYVTTGDAYTELWLPSQFPTGNVSLSRTFGVRAEPYGERGYPSAFTRYDASENSPFDFVENRRSPDSINNCDNYTQFYHPIHIEKSSTSEEKYTVGYNDQNKSVVCGTASENFWEPRYYLDIATATGTYSGNHCDSSTAVDAACLASPTGSSLYRECRLIGTDTPFTRPSEIVDSGFDFQNSDIDHSVNTYVKECEDLGYSGGTYELYDYKILSTVGGRYYVDIANLNSNERVDWITPAKSFSNYTNGASAQNYIAYRDIWARSDVRETRIGTSGPQFYLLGGKGVNPENKTGSDAFEAEGGLTWTRYGITEMLNYIQNQSINSTGTDTSKHRSAILQFSNNNNFNARTQRTLITDFTPVPINPDNALSASAGYLAGGGWTADRGTTTNNVYSSTLSLYAPYAELNCELRVPETASESVQAFFRACQSLSSYYETRFSYHKPIEVKDFNVGDVAFPPDGTLPTGDNFGHWRKALIDDSTKHPSLIKYGDASYNPPTYFHIKTDKTNGYFYCEANPTAKKGYGYIERTAQNAPIFPTRPTGTTVSNSACDNLNEVLGITTATSSTTFETISSTMSGSDRQIKDASDIGFIGHKEGPYDYYPCKWRAPFKGNPLAG